MARVVVAGALANKPGNGGEAWVRMSWARGLQQIGCDVTFVEQLATADSVDAGGRPAPLEASVPGIWFDDVVRQFGIADRAFLVREDDPGSPALLARLDRADLLVNISGQLTRADLLDRVVRRAYVDIDPGYTQYWHQQGALGDQLDRHQVHLTIGERIGTGGCGIPTGDIAWQPVRQPVLLDDWPVLALPLGGGFTTVGSWRGAFGPVTAEGVTYGLKVHEFRRLLDLPTRSGLPFELALAMDAADEPDRAALVAAGWRLASADAVSSTPQAFRSYVQGSAAEFSVAQGIYVQTRSGWFSDRTVRYLASGRPALVQETGFSETLPVGEGLLAFSTLEEAVDGAHRLQREHGRHAAAARGVAESFFAAHVVLPRMLEACGVAA